MNEALYGWDYTQMGPQMEETQLGLNTGETA